MLSAMIFHRSVNPQNVVSERGGSIEGGPRTMTAAFGKIEPTKKG